MEPDEPVPARRPRIKKLTERPVLEYLQESE
jgi:hypothetical protein